MPADLVPRGDSFRLRHSLDLLFSRYRGRYPRCPQGTSVQVNSGPVRLLVVNWVLQNSGRVIDDVSTMARTRPRQRSTGGKYMFETDCNAGADSSRREMTVRQFLESVPGVGELVVVTCGGWPTCTVHIDCEDYYRMPADIAHRKVLNSSFGSIKVTTRGPLPMDVPVRFVDC